MSSDGGRPISPLAPLPAWARFYFYGLHGLLDEIVFTALFDAFLSPAGNMPLKGHSSIFSFFIYGSCSFCVERLYVRMIERDTSLYARLAVYVCIVYIWEYTWGLVLRQFSACSWDYSHYPYNIHGLITLEYAPGWLILCYLQDVVYGYMLSLHVNINISMSKKNKSS